MKKILCFLAILSITLTVQANDGAITRDWDGSPQLNQEAAKLDWVSIRKENAVSKNGTIAEYQVGDTRTFWTWDLSVMPPGYSQTTATCRAKGQYSYIWVADDQWETHIFQADADKILTAWEINSPEDSLDPSSGIYQIDTGIFGEAPDELDNDIRIHILYYDVGSFAGTTFDGFFRMFDEMTEAEAQAQSQHSNECEILYLNSNGGTPPGNDYMLGVLAHEFQHMIHWLADPNEDLWVNEGCSQLAWFLTGYGTDGQETYFASHPNNDLTTWETNGDYGQVSLFFIYLFEHFNGIESMHQLVANKANGFEGLTSTFNDMGYHFDPKDVFQNWIIANLINDSNLDHGQYGYSTFTPPAFRIFDTYDAFPSGPVDGQISRWAGRYFSCLPDLNQLNIDFSFPSSETSCAAVVNPDGLTSRVIPADSQYPRIQAKFETNDGSVSWIIINNQSPGTSGEYQFSLSSEDSQDQTPPYILDSIPWGIEVVSPFAEIGIRDELSDLDYDSIQAQLNGETADVTIRTSPPDQFASLRVDLTSVEPGSDCDIMLVASDETGNAMSPAHLKFKMSTELPFTPKPTVTPTPPLVLGIKLEMPAEHFKTGDNFYLNAVISNPDPPKTQVPIFVILQIQDLFFFAPDWSTLDEHISYYERDLMTGSENLPVLSPFDWPSNTGSFEGARFYGAMTNTEMSALLGDMDYQDFSWME